MAANVVPFNSLTRHVGQFADELTAIGAEVLRSGHYVLGPGVSNFEREFAEYCGVGYCVGVANGTDALELGLRALGVQEGDKVALCANAAMYGTTAVLAIGAVPVFVDVNDVGTMDPGDLEAKTRSGDVKACIVTHLYGRLADMDRILPITSKSGIRLLEDCAQAHGAKSADGTLAGGFGDAASFSFYPTKNLGAVGDGGAVTTNNHAIAERLRGLRQYGWSQKYRNELNGGRNSRLDELQARFLSFFLPHLDGWNERRREIANLYSSSIRNPRITVPAVGGDDYVAHLYVVQCTDRDELREHLAGQSIQTDIHYPVPDYQQPIFGDEFREIHLTTTEELCRVSVSLPCFPEMTNEECARVIDACNKF